jgi:hypothetical protein
LAVTTISSTARSLSRIDEGKMPSACCPLAGPVAPIETAMPPPIIKNRMNLDRCIAIPLGTS